MLVIGGGQSGIYEVGEDINLGQLVALAGGGGRSGRRTKVKIHLFRLESGQRTKVVGEGIEDLAARSQYPSLQDGDVVRIETRERFNWRDILQISSTVLGLTITILTLFDIRA